MWINEKEGQLRYKASPDNPPEWLVPLSVYKVGNDRPSGPPLVRRGQPVSIGRMEDLSSVMRNSADAAVVPSNPRNHEWSIGVALEPGNSYSASESVFRKVHVLSHGRVEYSLSDTRDVVFQPPFSVSAGDLSINNPTRRYLWTYADAGKPVYVSNNPADFMGSQSNGLTLDISNALHDGGNPISIGRLVDAPQKGADLAGQGITIEVQPLGDVRGHMDTSQFNVTMETFAASDSMVFPGAMDRLVFVKVIGVGDAARGRIVASDEDMLHEFAQHSPIGAFLASSANNEVNLNAFSGAGVVCTRMGVVSGNFAFAPEDFGKELFLVNGNVTTDGPASMLEFKVGIILDAGRILVDSRYPKSIKRFAPVGDILPAYTDINPPFNVITTPGYIPIETGKVRKVSGAWVGPSPAPIPPSQTEFVYSEFNFAHLVEAVMFAGILEWTSHAAGNPNLPANDWRRIDGGDTFEGLSHGFWRFRDGVFFPAMEGAVRAQIKFNREGAPETVSHVWPERMFTHVWQRNFGNGPIQNDPSRATPFANPNPSWDITYLVNLGNRFQGDGQDIENYDISLKIIDPANSNRSALIPPGFFTAEINGQNFTYGYQWTLFRQGASWRLGMFTRPDGAPAARCLGITWPIAQRNDRNINLVVNIRRRPAKYHNLFLNQLMNQFPWAPFTTDGTDVVAKNTFAFGDVREITDGENQIRALEPGATTFTIEDPEPFGGTHWKKVIESYGGQHDGSVFRQIGLLRKDVVPAIDGTAPWNAQKFSGISWFYDFVNNNVGLSASMSLDLTARSTAWSEDGIFVENVANYNDGTRSALRTLREVPVAEFNYPIEGSELDSSLLPRVYGTAQEQWNIQNSNPDPERFMSPNQARPLFEVPSGEIPAPGTSYDFGNAAGNSQWANIMGEINNVFGNISWTNYMATQGGHLQTFQSNLGLLNYAARETQERLLKLERSLFGFNAPTMPEGLRLGTGFNNRRVWDSYNSSLDDGGMLRVSKQLFDNFILERPSTGTQPYSSMYRRLLFEIFGIYNEGNFVERRNAFLASDSTEGFIGKEGRLFKMYAFMDNLESNLSIRVKNGNRPEASSNPTSFLNNVSLGNLVTQNDLSQGTGLFTSGLAPMAGIFGEGSSVSLNINAENFRVPGVSATSIAPLPLDIDASVTYENSLNRLLGNVSISGNFLTVSGLLTETGRTIRPPDITAQGNPLSVISFFEGLPGRLTAHFSGEAISLDPFSYSFEDTDFPVQTNEISVGRGSYHKFEASALGFEIYPVALTWSVLEENRHPDTNINNDGLLFVSPSEPSETLTVRAQAEGSSAYDTMTVSLGPRIERISIRPPEKGLRVRIPIARFDDTPRELTPRGSVNLNFIPGSVLAEISDLPEISPLATEIRPEGFVHMFSNSPDALAGQLNEMHPENNPFLMGQPGKWDIIKTEMAIDSVFSIPPLTVAPAAVDSFTIASPLINVSGSVRALSEIDIPERCLASDVSVSLPITTNNAREGINVFGASVLRNTPNMRLSSVGISQTWSNISGEIEITTSAALDGISGKENLIVLGQAARSL